MKAFSHINIGEKISFIIGCKNYLILVVSSLITLALQALALARSVKLCTGNSTGEVLG